MSIDTHQDLAYRQKLPAFMLGEAGVTDKEGVLFYLADVMENEV